MAPTITCFSGGEVDRFTEVVPETLQQPAPPVAP